MWTMIFYLFVIFCTTVFSRALSEKVTRFGCTFEDDRYQVSGTYPVWSDPISGTRIADDNVRTISELIEKCKGEVYAETILDEMTPFVRIHNAMKASGERSVSTFAHSYAPPAGSRHLNMDLILKVVEKLNNKYGNYIGQNSLDFYFAGATLEAPEERVQQVRDLEETQLLNFQPDHTVGVIKIDLSTNKIAYVIIDMEFATMPSPFVVKDTEALELKRERYFPGVNHTSFGDIVDYEFLDPNNNYLQFSIVSRQNPGLVKSRNIIYVDRPFCSFVEAANLNLLTSPVKMVARISPQGNIQACLTSKVLEEAPKEYPASPRDKMATYSKDNAGSLPEMGMTQPEQVEDMNEEEENTLDKIFNRNEEEKAKLKETMKAIQKIVDEKKESDTKINPYIMSDLRELAKDRLRDSDNPLTMEEFREMIKSLMKKP